MTMHKRKRGVGITRNVFTTFFVVSILALVYINLATTTHLKLIADNFPEIDILVRKAFVRGYKMSMSFGLFFIDILLVGPFAWLSYFSDHIEPKRVGLIDKIGGFLENVSFFDIGLLLALDFTIAVIAFNFTIVNAVDTTPITFVEPITLWIVAGIGFVIWAIISLLKIYSYSPDQRNDLKKYIIRF